MVSIGAFLSIGQAKALSRFILFPVKVTDGSDDDIARRHFLPRREMRLTRGTGGRCLGLAYRRITVWVTDSGFSRPGPYPQRVGTRSERVQGVRFILFQTARNSKEGVLCGVGRRARRSPFSVLRQGISTSC